MAEFASPVDAMEAAIEIQKEVSAKAKEIQKKIIEIKKRQIEII